MTSSREIRRSFTSFFERHGHAHVESGPLVPNNDPTLMFANSGMVQFKDLFTGKEVRSYRRATTSQKCIRISGKHNDLENVGVTARHHTFFEMLGNFSFGDYFKKEAISFAWKLLSEELKLDPERLVFTIFAGQEGYGPRDDESAALWREITGCSADRIIACDAKDNFWQMGDTGPCGPCTEIHYYLGDGKPDPRTFGEEPADDGRGWFEIWNNVFMQFDRQSDGTLVPLPRPSVDTGAGLERLAVAMQGVLSNYDTDLLQPLVQTAARLAKKPYGRTQRPDDVSMRVIADHARTTAFLISEGIFPSNEGREYVLRRVMRRAIRHGHRLGIHENFLHECASQVVDLMGADYPQLVERSKLIVDVARDEEERFRRTMELGLDRLKTWVSAERSKKSDGALQLPGDVAFQLYDTFGFPIDLQDVIGNEQGFTVDHEGFDGALQQARQKSRASTLNRSQATEKVFFDLKDQFGATRFVGYDQLTASSEVLAIVLSGSVVTEASAGASVQVITRETPFYGEKGGQSGDAGIAHANGVRLAISDTQWPVADLCAHSVTITEGTLRAGSVLSLEVDRERRDATRRNHSATHLLHWALRQVVGETAVQKGSLVSHDRLRFDYAGNKPLTAEQVTRIEDLVNRAILENHVIETREMGMADAKASGAIGIFEEKYGDVVRVLRMGPSAELCGGTHATRTGDIGLFSMVAETGLAAGVRRIEAATGWMAISRLRSLEGTLAEAAALFKAAPSDVPARIAKALDQQKTLQKEIERLQKDLAGGSRDLASEAREIDGVRFLAAALTAMDGKGLREMADGLKDKLAPAVVLLGAPTPEGDKVTLICSVTKDLTSRYKAGDIIKRAAAEVGGSGGGRPDFAQAGGTDTSRLDAAIASLWTTVG